MATAGLSSDEMVRDRSSNQRRPRSLAAAARRRSPPPLAAARRRRRRRISRRRTAPAHRPLLATLQVREAQIRLYHNRQRAQLKDHLRAMTGRGSTKVGTDQLMLAAQLAKLPLPEQVRRRRADPRSLPSAPLSVPARLTFPHLPSPSDALRLAVR
jgi:hypothetical protein